MNTRLLIVYAPPGATRPLVLADVESGAALQVAARCAISEARSKVDQDDTDTEHVGFLERTFHLLIPGFKPPVSADRDLQVQ